MAGPGMGKAPISDAATRAARRLLTKQPLARVDLTVTSSTVVARAFPIGSHPTVAKRREEAFAEKAKGGGSISLQEATEINSESMKAVASGQGRTIDEAIADLTGKLQVG